MDLALPTGYSAVPERFDLPEAGMSDTLTVEAGESVTRSGVLFSCDSDYPCTITLTNSAGTLLATWSSQAEADADDPVVMAARTPDTLTPGPTAGGLATRAVTGDVTTGLAGVTAVGGISVANVAKMKRTSDGVSFELTDEFITAHLDTDEPDTDTTAPPNVGKIVVAAHTGRADQDWGGGSQTTAFVHTTIEAPESMAAVQDGHLIGETRDIALDRDTNSDGQFDALNVTDTLLSMAKIQDSSLGADKTLLAGEEIDANDERSGTYDGVPGTFTCQEVVETSDCTLTYDKKKGTIAAGGAWSFKSTSGATVMVQDRDWMAYGAWLTHPDNRTGGHHAFGLVATGSDQFGVDDRATGGATPADNLSVEALTGKATYEGNALGIYVSGAHAGMFSADAELTADFAAADAMGTVTGTIDTFTDAVSGRSIGDWMLGLGSGTIAGDITDGFTAGATAVSGHAAGVPWARGSWTSMFYGDGESATGHPSGIAGTFEATTVTATPTTLGTTGTAVAGAFGAERKAE
ncbi:MAG: hypothetical protein OXE57_11885 [Alphaproteobacteria bacterium]|nr:hypothetical protein [Alphaproteobacteria bacterium]